MNKFIKQEVNERKCFWTCQGRSAEKFVAGDLEGAEQAALDALKSIRELKKLQKAKENREQLERVIKRLQEQGVLVERVAKIG